MMVLEAIQQLKLDFTSLRLIKTPSHSLSTNILRLS